MSEKTDQQREAERLQKYNQSVKAEIDKAVLACTQSHEGRALLWWLLEQGRVNTQPFSRDPYTAAFNCGELNVGNQVLARIIEVNPEGYLTMMKEKQVERTSIYNASDDRADRPVIAGAFDGIAADVPERDD